MIESESKNNLNCINLDDIIKDVKNFNLHVKVLKKLMNLQDRRSGYDLYLRPKTGGDSTKSSPSGSTNLPTGLASADRNKEDFIKLDQLKKEIQESHELGFCLMFILQCLQKRLTGLPIDRNRGSDLMRQLKDKFDHTKTEEDIFKYDLQQRRSTLNKLKSDMKETRDDRRNIRIIKPKLYEQGLDENNYASKSPLSSSSSSSSSEDKNDSYIRLMASMDDRKTRLDRLEEECFNFFKHLTNRGESPPEEDLLGIKDSESASQKLA